MRSVLRASHLCVVSLLVGAVLAWPTAASATPGCVGAACNGLLASDENCVDDSYVLSGATAQNGGDLTLRYSPTCKAVWAEFFTRTTVSDRDWMSLTIDPEYGGVESDADNVELNLTDTDFVTKMTDFADKSVMPCVDVALVVCGGWR